MCPQDTERPFRLPHGDERKKVSKPALRQSSSERERPLFDMVEHYRLENKTRVLLVQHGRADAAALSVQIPPLRELRGRTRWPKTLENKGTYDKYS